MRHICWRWPTARDVIVVDLAKFKRLIPLTEKPCNFNTFYVRKDGLHIVYIHTTDNRATGIV